MQFIMNYPVVSVIITTKNEEKNIANCLKSILRQTYPCDKIEIIVVDNNSTDKTKEIALSFFPSLDKEGLGAVGNPSIQFYTKGPERSAQRNFGVNKSKGGYFLYLDADMILSPGVIKECVEKTQNSKLQTQNMELVALYIPEIIMGNSFWCKVRRFERSFYDGTVIDCARFIEKNKFLEVGGFDESLSGPEDWDLDRKLRQIGKVGLIKSPIYHNEAEFDLKKYLNKKSYYAKSFGAYISKWGANDPEIKKQFGFYYRFFGVFIENGKWKKMLRHPILALGMYFLRFSVGVGYIIRVKVLWLIE